ncbi:long-chain fatty acid transport protein 2-like [Glandiceps talaboti]
MSDIMKDDFAIPKVDATVFERNALQKLRSGKEVLQKWLTGRRFYIDAVEESMTKYAHRDCLVFGDNVYTYADVDRRSNQFANFVLRRGLKFGDTVAVLMYNEPAFFWTVFGLAKVGIKGALLNVNLRNDSLVHCLDICHAKIIVVGEGTLQDKGISVWFLGENIHSTVSPIVQTVQSEVRETTDKTIARETRRKIDKHDTVVYIFTSGTTGATMILAPKFSVSKFWDDIIEYQVTAFLHVGEICRYLLSRPKSEKDTCHRLRLMIGNGLSKDVWKEFQTRFRIPVIYEFYGATESTFRATNMDNTICAVGRFTPRLKEVSGFELVHCDIETAEPIRNSYGRCIPVKLGEAGLLIHRTPDLIKFAGYEGDQEMSERKLLRNVFVEGDEYYSTGDLFRLAKDYYLYFVDRLGDSFRWKGENVSVIEVAQKIVVFPGITDTRVYGVKVPGHDGRAGMAAVVLKHPKLFNFAQFYNHVTSQLPKYACPLFLRVGESFDMTVTYKVINTKLKKEGFDPNVVDDQLFYMDTKQKTYLPLTGDEFKRIMMGKSRL